MDVRSLINNSKIKAVIIALSALIMLVAFVFQWWFFAPLSAFQAWYPHTGLLLWAAKCLIAFFTFLVVVYYAVVVFVGLGKFLLSKRYYAVSVFIFVAVIILGFRFNTHPFSNFPMYTSFPNWSYVFILEDLDGKQLPFKEYTNYAISDVTDLYFNYMIQRNVKYGGIESREIAQQAAAAIGESMVLKKKISGFRLIRLYYKTERDKVVETRDVLYEKHF